MLQIRHVLSIPKTTPYRDTIHVYVPNGNGLVLPKVLFHTLCHHFKKIGKLFLAVEGKGLGWESEGKYECNLVVRSVLIWCLITIRV